MRAVENLRNVIVIMLSEKVITLLLSWIAFIKQHLKNVFVNVEYEYFPLVRVLLFL